MSAWDIDRIVERNEDHGNGGQPPWGYDEEVVVDDFWDFAAFDHVGMGRLPEYEQLAFLPPYNHLDNNLPPEPTPRYSPPPPSTTAPLNEQLPNHMYPLWGAISDDEEEVEAPQPTNRPSPTLSESASAEFVTLEDTTDEEEEEEEEGEDNMPANTRARRNNAARRASIVDLTSAPSPAGSNRPRASKRRRSTDVEEGPAPKRSTRRRSGEEIEELDLTNEAPSADEEFLQQQQKAAFKAQQEEESQGPQKIGQRQCIICMENYTNATATACGHFYCHECLVRAIMAGERNSDRGSGTCPVCRKPLSRKKKNDIIPISFMKKSQFSKNQSKRTDILT